jgi:hypothetical protein
LGLDFAAILAAVVGSFLALGPKVEWYSTMVCCHYGRYFYHSLVVRKLELGTAGKGGIVVCLVVKVRIKVGS